MSQEQAFKVGCDNWVTIPEPPERAPVRSALAKMLIERAKARLGMQVVVGDESDGDDRPDFGAIGNQAPILYLRRPDSLYRRLGVDGIIGFGEGFQSGDWDSDDLAALLTVLVSGVDKIVPPLLQRIRPWAVRRHRRSDQQTVDGALQNARHHYALPDALFRAFMDETMCYSSAIFPTDDNGRVEAHWASLASAQRRKLDRLLDLAGVGEGTRMLEIGTGWGELAVRAAQRGAFVHTVTNMTEHADMAGARISAAGVSDRVRVQVGDYRDVAAEPGSFDSIVSVEMVEAVGRQYWPVFFRRLDTLLAADGRIGLQTMSQPHARMLRTNDRDNWTAKYVFPGGKLPSIQAFEQILVRDTALHITDRLSFGTHYAATLALWRERFNWNWVRVAELGFDEVFRRTWNFYLATAEAGFAARYLDVHQLLLER